MGGGLPHLPHSLYEDITPAWTKLTTKVLYWHYVPV